MGKGITFGRVLSKRVHTENDESSNNIPFKLVEAGDIAFVNMTIAEERHKGYEPIGATCEKGIWYIFVRKKVGIGFEYL